MRLSVPIYQLKRQAKTLSRQNAIPLNKVLNNIAKQEGFQNWSLLAAHHAASDPAAKIFAALAPGDLVLLGARPGHGKTLMGFDLIAESIKCGSQAAFYSLEYTESEVVERFAALGVGTEVGSKTITFDTSDNICADYIIGQLSNAQRGTVVIIDYLQLLDQNRKKPVLSAQISALKSFAEAAGIIIVTISQIDRSYDPAAKLLPDITDVRLPNPLDLNLFTKTVFLNNGTANLQAVV